MFGQCIVLNTQCSVCHMLRTRLELISMVCSGHLRLPHVRSHWMVRLVVRICLIGHSEGSLRNLFNIGISVSILVTILKAFLALGQYLLTNVDFQFSIGLLAFLRALLVLWIKMTCIRFVLAEL